MITLLWLKNGTDRWHAWNQGAARSRCGSMTLHHLPAALITEEVTGAEELAKRCRRCVSLTHEREPLRGPAELWLLNLHMRLRHTHVTVGENELRALAERLAELGPPTEPNVAAVYAEIAPVLMRPIVFKVKPTTGPARALPRVTRLGRVLKALPPGGEPLRRVAEAFRAWRMVSGLDVTREQFDPERVVLAAYEAPDPIEAYVRMLVERRGLRHIAQVFHPTTAERSRKDPNVRGLFRGAGTYLAQAHLKVRK